MPLFRFFLPLLLLALPLAAEIVPHGLPEDYVRASDLVVKVNDTVVPVLAVLPQYDYGHFSGAGPLRVTITAQEAVRSWRISPLAYHIPAEVSGNQLTFTLARPAYLIVKLNDRRELVLAADEPEIDAPDLKDPRTRV